MRRQRPGYFMQAGQHRIFGTAKSGAPTLVDEKARLAFSIFQNVTISHGEADSSSALLAPRCVILRLTQKLGGA